MDPNYVSFLSDLLIRISRPNSLLPLVSVFLTFFMKDGLAGMFFPFFLVPEAGREECPQILFFPHPYGQSFFPFFVGGFTSPFSSPLPRNLPFSH